VQNTNEISSIEILSFEVTKDVLMIDVNVAVSESSSESGGLAAPSVSDVLKSLNLSGDSKSESDEKASGGDNTVVNPWTVESDGAIDYLR
jgi:hypothetical protein